MNDVINLNKERKAKAKIEKEKTAENNRRKFGRTKQEKKFEKDRVEMVEEHVDAHKLEDKDE